MLMFFLWQNNDIVTTEIKYNNSKIPDEFKGYKIVHISDLHNKKFGKEQNRLLKKIQASSPDMIVITGDLVDSRKYDLDTAMTFIDGAMKISPVYYVSGNNEAATRDYENIESRLSDSGVIVLDDAKAEIIKNESKIELLGLADPTFGAYTNKEGTASYKLKKRLDSMTDYSVFQMLISHRPEYFRVYANENIDLIFTGHAHGGQIRIPFIGGLIAPNQGLFPKYTSGMYNYKDSSMVVSRGLGNSLMPQRIFNRPEIVVVTLQN